mgnify:CR=1 FL=1
MMSSSVTDTNSLSFLITFMRYSVHCPALNETENCASQDHAIDVAYSMYRESNSTVWVEDYLGHTVIELGD